MSKNRSKEVLQIKQKTVSPGSTRDRLIEFLGQCLEKHMRKGSRFSCFLNSPESKHLDDRFIDAVIANPDVDFYEEEISLEVPAHCRYFSGNKALVVTIVKRV